MQWMRDSAVDIKKARDMTSEELSGKFVIGEFKNRPALEYCHGYQKIIDSLKEGNK
jgi:2-oxoglutarate ferredoxin oxidoreductase subunit beta